MEAAVDSAMVAIQQEAKKLRSDGQQGLDVVENDINAVFRFLKLAVTNDLNAIKTEQAFYRAQIERVKTKCRRAPPCKHQFSLAKRAKRRHPILGLRVDQGDKRAAFGVLQHDGQAEQKIIAQARNSFGNTGGKHAACRAIVDHRRTENLQ
ncbi:hypothetical protein NGA_0173500 [Nannochloropsis gaditana CCMP526]|nr:hypothetical protein NGA_0173500 [Nannochloropsis gaditana CCMP526]EKU21973.1 hypothetical protein NGA_0173500 [Nannochloropsis gaditana CCMP526]|eukprot:XP_005854387.1 hypothetical protein NGA_0173500 [Nannochloropsis gaditana CCMP526]